MMRSMADLVFLLGESVIPDMETDLCTPGREILYLNWLNYNPFPFKYIQSCFLKIGQF